MVLDPETRLAIAQALSRDGAAYVLNESNERVRCTDLERAVAEDDSYYVLPRGGLIVGDFDSEYGVKHAGRVHHDLLLAGYSPLLTASGTPGRAHLIVKILDPDARKDWEQALRTAGADVRKGAGGIRPPYTRHRRLAKVSEPILGLMPTEVLRRVSCAGDRAEWPEDIAPHVHETICEEGDRSEAIFRFAQVVARRGWSYDEALFVLESSESAISRTYLEATKSRSHEGDKWFRDHIWPSASLDVLTADHLIRLRARHSDPGWTYPGASSDHAVYGLLVRIAEQCGKLVVGASTRRIAEEAGLGSRNTVRAALGRLTQKGLLEPIDREEIAARGRSRMGAQSPKQSNYYRLILPEASSPARVISGVTSEAAVAFRNRTGLGQWTSRTYQHLEAAGEPLTIQELTERVGYQRRTVSKHLDQLSEAGLVVQADGRWSISPVVPADVATPEARAAQDRLERAHDVERRIFGQKLAEGLSPQRLTPRERERLNRATFRTPTWRGGNGRAGDKGSSAV